MHSVYIDVFKILIVLLLVAVILKYFNGDSVWTFDPPSKGVTVKIQGTVPARNDRGFSKFPGDRTQIRMPEKW